MDRTPDPGDNPVIARSHRSWRLKKAQGTPEHVLPWALPFQGRREASTEALPTCHAKSPPTMARDRPDAERPRPPVLPGHRRRRPPGRRIGHGRTDPACLIEARRISRKSRRAGGDEEDAEGNGGRRRPSFRRLPKETVRRRTWPSPKSWYWSSFQSWYQTASRPPLLALRT